MNRAKNRRHTCKPLRLVRIDPRYIRDESPARRQQLEETGDSGQSAENIESPRRRDHL